MDYTQVRDMLIAAGVDYDTALRRMMGKESLYYRFLNQFLDDENYGLLLEAAGQGDSDIAFQAAHTLKGVCGNRCLRKSWNGPSVWRGKYGSGKAARP